jgi:uncharacterized protein
MPGSRFGIAVLLVMIVLLTAAASPQTQTRPKVRALTAFIRVDAAKYEDQIQDALKFLRRARQAYADRGYEVQTIRITTQPFPEIVRGLSDQQATSFFHGLDELAKRDEFIPNVGPAMLADNDPPVNADLLARILTTNEQVEGSIVVAGEDGVHWNAVRAAAKILKQVSEKTVRSEGTFGFTATAMLGPLGPFFPGSYHTGAGHQFSIGLESANVVQAVLSSNPGNLAAAEKALARELGRYAVECEQVAQSVEKETGWTYAGIDPTPAPGGDISIGDAIEKFTGAKFGSSGTMTAAAMITRAVKSLPVKHVGYSGLMVAVLEDSVLAKRWSEGLYNVDSILAYSAVCGTGLDTIPLPGDVTEEQLARMIGDMASLAYKWKKPLSARLQPVAGKKAGDRTEFQNPHLTNVVLRSLP